MPNIVVPKYIVSTDATTLKVLEIAGEYVVSVNEGGWGPPNEALSDCAIFMIAIRKALSGDQVLVAKTVSVNYNDSALNTDQPTLEFVWKNDGVIYVTVGLLRVTVDGLNYKSDSAAIQEGDYYYLVNDANPVRRIESGQSVIVTDLTTLIGEDTIIQTTKKDVLAPRLALLYQKLYKQYKLKFKENSKCQEAKDFFYETNFLLSEIRGSFYQFFSGLESTAQLTIEDLLEQYQISDL